MYSTAHLSHSPFNLTAIDSYRRWRDIKLNGYPSLFESLIVEIRSINNITNAEKEKIKILCQKTNMAFYAGSTPLERNDIKVFAKTFGLKNLDMNFLSETDNISSISVKNFPDIMRKKYKNYIPYTDQPLAWHTDGYYNPSHQLVRGMILHCVTPATVGGESTVLDPDILYIRLRDEAPEAVEILSRPDSMIIPANNETRPDRVGPVFSCDLGGRHLHMRYTHRTRSIIWHREAVAAAKRLRAILDTEDVPYIFHHRLESGQGLICNNVLHARTSFRDTPHRRRLLYRARFLERITNTSAS